MSLGGTGPAKVVGRHGLNRLEAGDRGVIQLVGGAKRANNSRLEFVNLFKKFYD